MSKRSWKLFLVDMVESVDKALRYVSGLDFQDFLQDTKTQDAVVRNLEVLGEAAKCIPADVQQKNPGIPWAQIIGMRDRLIHGYFSVDPAIVWEIVTKELPELKEELEKLLEQAPDFT